MGYHMTLQSLKIHTFLDTKHVYTAHIASVACFHNSCVNNACIFLQVFIFSSIQQIFFQHT
jgi:hypothetical protein